MKGFRSIVFILSLMVSVVCSAYEGSRAPVIVGIQAEGRSAHQPLIDGLSESLSHVLDDKVFIFRTLSASSLNDPGVTDDLDYLFSSASIFAAMQHYAGFSPVASVTPSVAFGPEHASATVIVVRQGDRDLKTVGDLKNLTIGVEAKVSPDVNIQLREEFNQRGIKVGKNFAIAPLEFGNLGDLFTAFTEKKISVAALGLATYHHLDEKTLNAYGLRVLEPRLNDDLFIAHTTQTYPGWVLSAGYKVGRDAAVRMGAFLRTMDVRDGWRWTMPADFQTLHTVLQRSDPFYTGFRPKNIRDYLKEYQAWIVGFCLLLLGVVLHSLRTGHLLRKRTRELTVVNERQLESERRYHLLEKQSIVGQISSIVAHEIRQPLAAVSNYAMALRRRHDNDALDAQSLSYGLNCLVAESGRANEIVNYVQKFVRTSEKAKKWLNVTSLLGEIANSYTNSHGQALVVLKSAPPISYYMDAMDLSLMVRNLVKNGLEASRSGSDAVVEISIGSTADGGIAVSVSDSGPALSDEAFRKLSTPLNTTKIGGLGLGLSIVRLIAESYGGHMEFSRRTPAGLVVTIILPESSEEPSGGQHE